jgi:hypothetical protein
VLPAGGEGVGFSTLAERYGERIRCFTPPQIDWDPNLLSLQEVPVDCGQEVLMEVDDHSVDIGVRVNQRNRFPPNVCGFPLPARLQCVEPPGGAAGSGNPQTFSRKR